LPGRVHWIRTEHVAESSARSIGRGLLPVGQRELTGASDDDFVARVDIDFGVHPQIVAGDIELDRRRVGGECAAGE